MLSQQMTDTEFFNIMAQVYNIKLDEADEWSFISAAREDRALVMNDRSQLDTLKADLKAAQAENARLRETLKSVRAIINPMPEANAYYEAQLDFVLDQEIDAITLIDEALQPAEVSDHDDQPVSE